MANLIQCSNNYVCLEQFIEFLLSLFFLYYQIASYRIILKDKSGTIVLIDRYLCLASIILTFIQTIYFIRLDSDLFLSTQRYIGISMLVIICNIFGSIIVDDQSVAKVWLLTKGLLVLVFIEWFWTGFIHQSSIDYNCVQIDYLLQSGTGLFFALAAFCLGNQVLEGMQNSKNQIEAQCKGNLKIKQYESQLEQATTRIEQVNLMHYCGLFQFSIQFAFDLFTYLKCQNKGECQLYYNSHSFIQVIFLVIFKLFTFSTIPATIFIIFFEKNKSKFINEDDNIEMNIIK